MDKYFKYSRAILFVIIALFTTGTSLVVLLGSLFIVLSFQLQHRITGQPN